MIKFLFILWGMARLYRFRLVLGVLAGMIAGAAEPLMLVVVGFVFSVVFPSADKSPTLVISLRYYPRVENFISQAQDMIVTLGLNSTGILIAVVSLIPLAMLIR